MKPPALVTGTATMLSHDYGVGSPPDEKQVREGVVFTHRWEASDPRLSGTATFWAIWHEYASGDFSVDASTRVVENDAGRWVGTATALAGPGIETDTVILHGEDAYEGLTAYVLIDFRVFPIEFVAAIFPGEMPPFPEPAAE
jgi:hypothetical protein